MDVDKNIWEQVSSAFECRETGEPLNTIAALFVFISLDEDCDPFIMLFLIFKNYLGVFEKTFLKMCSLTITFPSSSKSHKKKLTSLFGENPYLCRQLSLKHIHMASLILGLACCLNQK